MNSSSAGMGISSQHDLVCGVVHDDIPLLMPGIKDDLPRDGQVLLVEAMKAMHVKLVVAGGLIDIEHGIDEDAFGSKLVSGIVLERLPYF